MENNANLERLTNPVYLAARELALNGAQPENIQGELGSDPMVNEGIADAYVLRTASALSAKLMALDVAERSMACVLLAVQLLG